MTQTSKLALVDSNILVYALVKDYPDSSSHAKSLALVEKGIKGELNQILCLNPIVVVETYSALKRLVDERQAEFRLSSLLKSRRIGFITVSRTASVKAVRWARDGKVPVNDAMMAATAIENSAVLYTADEEHFSRLKKYGVIFEDPTRSYQAQ